VSLLFFVFLAAFFYIKCLLQNRHHGHVAVATRRGNYTMLRFAAVTRALAPAL
jgi:hypothetical protein